jgi:hypothetical protein
LVVTMARCFPAARNDATRSAAPAKKVGDARRVAPDGTSPSPV